MFRPVAIGLALEPDITSSGSGRVEPLSKIERSVLKHGIIEYLADYLVRKLVKLRHRWLHDRHN